jgi:hypothetical protein
MENNFITKTVKFEQVIFEINCTLNLNIKINKKPRKDLGGINDYLNNKDYFHGGS